MDPISGIVALVTAYMTYRATVKQAEASSQTPPTAPAEAEQGQQALAVIEDAVVTHGTPDDKTDLERFVSNPQRNASVFEDILRAMAQKPEVAQQLQQILNANQQVGGVHGGVHLSGDARVDGIAAGVITGGVTFNAGARKSDDEKGAR